MPTLSTHVIDGAAGGGRADVEVELRGPSGDLVASTVTDRDGRAALDDPLPVGTYTLTWRLGGSLLQALSASFDLSGEGHYHLPVVASAASGTVYRGG